MPQPRILREYKKICKKKYFSENIKTIHPISTQDLTKWHSIITGPQKSPYEGKYFLLDINIPEKYPFDPPVVKFNTISIPPHCNIDKNTGKICLNILTKEHWSPAWDIPHVVSAIIQLLSNPDETSPLNIDLSNILASNDILAYTTLIHHYTNNLDIVQCNCEN